MKDRIKKPLTPEQIQKVKARLKIMGCPSVEVPANLEVDRFNDLIVARYCAHKAGYTFDRIA